MLSPLLYFLFTHESVAADHTQVVGPIPDNDETAYRKVRDLAVWCQDNNISLNISKTKELIVDYRKWKAKHSPNLHQQDCSGAGCGLQVPQCPHSLGIYHGPNTPTQL